jgi:hypothetical protein
VSESNHELRASAYTHAFLPDASVADTRL